MNITLGDAETFVLGSTLLASVERQHSVLVTICGAVRINHVLERESWTGPVTITGVSGKDIRILVPTAMEEHLI